MKKFYLMVKERLCNIESDKYLHFIVCMILTLILMFVFNSSTMSIAVVMSIGILKELFDKYIMKESFDTSDILADAWGVFVGLVVLILIKNIIMWKL